MKSALKIVCLLVVIVLTFGLSFAQDAAPVVLGPITQRIIDRGELICGTNASGLGGFSEVDASGQYTGFDVDMCRAVAAAILGNADAVSYRPLAAADRQAAIQSEEIDILSRNTTFTLSRDAVWGASFAPTTFYDGQGVMVMADSGITTLEGLGNLIICTNAGTTTELNITDAMNQAGQDFDLQTFQEFDQAMEAFLAGSCDGVTSDLSGLVSERATAPDPGAILILANADGSDFLRISKEPLGPLTPQSDAQFADIVRWTIYGLIAAEEYGITSENIDQVIADNTGEDGDPNIQRILGIGENQSGSYFGIANNFVEVVIRQVGNYGEIFQRHLGVPPFNMERGLNALYTDGGLMYSPPFR